MTPKKKKASKIAKLRSILLFNILDPPLDPMCRNLVPTFLSMRFKTSAFISIGLAVSMMAACSEKPDVAADEGGELKESAETKVDLGASVLDLFPDTGVDPVEGSADAEQLFL